MSWQLTILLAAFILAAGYYFARRKSARNSKQLLNGMEDTLIQFTQELEEDNIRLLREFADMKTELENRLHHLAGRVELLEKQVTECLQAPLKLRAETAGHSPRQATAEVATLQLSQPDTSAALEQDAGNHSADARQNMKERYKNLFALRQSGKSIEQIAKKLGINKGEVELIIKLAKQEEQFRF
ncbi:MAG TPA: hypothetical protein VF260_12300 [Bacilli bacterium]